MSGIYFKQAVVYCQEEDSIQHLTWLIELKPHSLHDQAADCVYAVRDKKVRTSVLYLGFRVSGFCWLFLTSYWQGFLLKSALSVLVCVCKFGHFWPFSSRLGRPSWRFGTLQLSKTCPAGLLRNIQMMESRKLFEQAFMNLKYFTHVSIISLQNFLILVCMKRRTITCGWFSDFNIVGMCSFYIFLDAIKQPCIKKQSWCKAWHLPVLLLKKMDCVERSAHAKAFAIVYEVWAPSSACGEDLRSVDLEKGKLYRNKDYDSADPFMSDDGMVVCTFWRLCVCVSGCLRDIRVSNE